jgi:hypothetical protein
MRKAKEFGSSQIDFMSFCGFSRNKQQFLSLLKWDNTLVVVSDEFSVKISQHYLQQILTQI